VGVWLGLVGGGVVGGWVGAEGGVGVGLGFCGVFFGTQKKTKKKKPNQGGGVPAFLRRLAHDPISSLQFFMRSRCAVTGRCRG